MTGRRVLGGALAVVLVLAGGVAGGCSSGASGASTDAAGAKTCTELVERAGKVAEQVLAGVKGKSIDDLRAANPGDPYAVLTKPFAAFEARAEQLGCDRTELRRVACDAYQGLTPDGPVAEEFLSRVRDTCR